MTRESGSVHKSQALNPKKVFALYIVLSDFILILKTVHSHQCGIKDRLDLVGMKGGWLWLRRALRAAAAPLWRMDFGRSTMCFLEDMAQENHI